MPNLQDLLELGVVTAIAFALLWFVREMALKVTAIADARNERERERNAEQAVMNKRLDGIENALIRAGMADQRDFPQKGGDAT